MPGSTNTAGRFSAGTPAPAGPRERATAVAARVPLASCAGPRQRADQAEVGRRVVDQRR